MVFIAHFSFETGNTLIYKHLLYVKRVPGRMPANCWWLLLSLSGRQRPQVVWRCVFKGRGLYGGKIFAVIYTVFIV